MTHAPETIGSAPALVHTFGDSFWWLLLPVAVFALSALILVCFGVALVGLLVTRRIYRRAIIRRAHPSIGGRQHVATSALKAAEGGVEAAAVNPERARGLTTARVLTFEPDRDFYRRRRSRAGEPS